MQRQIRRRRRTRTTAKTTTKLATAASEGMVSAAEERWAVKPRAAKARAIFLKMDLSPGCWIEKCVIFLLRVAHRRLTD